MLYYWSRLYYEKRILFKSGLCVKQIDFEMERIRILNYGLALRLSARP